MTRNHFNHAASMVKAIADGKWTDEPPFWAESIPDGEVDAGYSRVETVDNYTRAVQTAEAFIMLFTAFNPLFDQTRFLQACGLVDVPKKEKR